MTAAGVIGTVVAMNVVAAAFAFFVAAEKNRSLTWWPVLTLAFGVVALIALAGIPPVSEEEYLREDAPSVSASGVAWNPLQGPPPGSQA